MLPLRTSSLSVRPMPSMVAPSTGVMAPASNQAYDAGLRRPTAAAASTKAGKAAVRALSGPPWSGAPALPGAGGAAAAADTLRACRHLSDGAPARRAPASIGRLCSRPLQGRREDTWRLAAGSLRCGRASDGVIQARLNVGERCAGARVTGYSRTCSWAALWPPGSASRRLPRRPMPLPIALAAILQRFCARPAAPASTARHAEATSEQGQALCNHCTFAATKMRTAAAPAPGVATPRRLGRLQPRLAGQLDRQAAYRRLHDGCKHHRQRQRRQDGAPSTTAAAAGAATPPLTATADSLAAPLPFFPDRRVSCAGQRPLLCRLVQTALAQSFEL